MVFPAVAFRPIRLFLICLALTALAVIPTALLGHVMVGVFFGIVAHGAKRRGLDALTPADIEAEIVAHRRKPDPVTPGGIK